MSSATIREGLAPTTNNGFLIREPAEVYHAKAAEYLSSHQLADFRKCPQLYFRKKQGLIEEEERPAYLIGRAVHVLVLEGRDRFEEEFAVGGPINPRTGEVFGSGTKAFAEWAAAQGRPVLTVAQLDFVEDIADGVRAHGIATDLLSEGVPEGVMRAKYRDVPCQVRLDWFDPLRGIVDLKTCDDLTWFEADAKRYGYAYQMAFYRAVVAQVIGVYMPVHLIAVEKKEPYRSGVWRMDSSTLANAQKENEAAIERLKRCVAAETWPTGYEEVRLFDLI